MTRAPRLWFPGQNLVLVVDNVWLSTARLKSRARDCNLDCFQLSSCTHYLQVRSLNDFRASRAKHWCGGVSRTGETHVSGRCPPMSQKNFFARSIDGSWTLHNMLTVCIFNFGQHFSNIPVDLDSRNCTKGRGETLKKISRAPRAKQVCPGCPERAKHGCPNEKSCPLQSFSARTCRLRVVAARWLPR